MREAVTDLAPRPAGSTNFDATSWLIHAVSKAGKSTLSTTAPPPICVLDAEGGWRFVKEAGYKTGKPLRRKEWDPIREPPPRYDGTWDFCHVVVSKWPTLQTAYQYLARPADHDFASVILDSITESQRRLKRHIAPNGSMKGWENWEALLVNMDQLIRDMRDLVLLPNPNPLRCVMFIAETEMKDGSWRPAMQGQIGRSLPYLVDCCGYLYTDKITDDKGTLTGKMKKLLIGQGVADAIISGERFQGALPDIVDDPHITDMMNQIFGGVPSDHN